MERTIELSLAIGRQALLVDLGNRFALVAKKVKGKWVTSSSHLWTTGSPRLPHSGKLSWNPNTGVLTGAKEDKFLKIDFPLHESEEEMTFVEFVSSHAADIYKAALAQLRNERRQLRKAEWRFYGIDINGVNMVRHTKNLKEEYALGWDKVYFSVDGEYIVVNGVELPILSKIPEYKNHFEDISKRIHISGIVQAGQYGYTTLSDHTDWDGNPKGAILAGGEMKIPDMSANEMALAFYRAGVGHSRLIKGRDKSIPVTDTSSVYGAKVLRNGDRVKYVINNNGEAILLYHYMKKIVEVLQQSDIWRA